MQLSGASASRESGQEGTHGIAPEVLARLSAANDHVVFAAALFKNARRMMFGPQFLLQMVRSECSNADATIV